VIAVTLLRRCAVVAVLLAVLLAACSSGDEEIAWVGGTVIHLSDIDALFEGDTLPMDDTFLETLYLLMALEGLTQGLTADYGVTVDPAAAGAYLTQLEASRAEQGLTPAQFLGVANASDEMIHFNAEMLALRDAVIEHLLVSPETVDLLFADPATMTTVCVKHILLATQEEADAVKARLEAGEDFATVAAEVSIDTTAQGGDLGCAPASTYVYEFSQAAMTAPLGQVGGPVETEFGWHVLIVSERTTPTREEYLADPESMLSEEDISGLWTEWFNTKLQEVDARVAEKYGTWTAIGIKAPETATTTTSSAG
jgi:parvulin-like peptidyl-prolyl isomerase